jgi:hypothetical protein
MKNTLSCFSAVMTGDDVGMIERGEQPRLAQKLAEVETLAVRHFQRDALVDPGVFGEDTPVRIRRCRAVDEFVLPSVCPRKTIRRSYRLEMDS